MQLHQQRDVVLLNADTEVYDGWLDRLVAAALRHPKTATVTPLSNNATICSYPRTRQDNPYPLEISYSALNALAAEVNDGVEVEAPSGVGFCMYIRRDCLDEVGLFDHAAFGKGYGEENDFCQRASERGWRNVIAADTFVRHLGSASFLGERARRVKQAMKTMDRLHPRYQDDVKAFIQRDPLADARARLDWARLLRLRREKNVLIVSHNRGGGTERHVQEDAEKLSSKDTSVFFMRPVRTDKTRVVLEHRGLKVAPNLEVFELGDVERLAQRLQALGITEIHTHSLVDYVPESPKYIRRLVELLGARWEVNLHDYKVICPRVNLTDRSGRYCGEPDEEGCNYCLATRGSSFGIRDIRLWRVMHWQALEAADEVLVPDDDVAMRLSHYFPGLEMTVSPHESIESPSGPAEWEGACRTARLHVVVVGAISKKKGIDVLLRCARNARRRRLPLDFSVLGYTQKDSAARREGIRLTGPYRDEEAVERLRGLRPDVIWLPSIWPETYSYTLSIALQSDCPVAAFDIGAIAARLKRIDRASCILPLSLVNDPGRINARFLAAMSTRSTELAESV
jgi:glycosyltransferase involved in cell wall biosynthesis